VKGKIHVQVDKFKWEGSTGNEETKQTIKLHFNVQTTIKDLARAIHWQKAGAPLYIDIGSDLIDDDLEIRKVNYQLDFIAEKVVSPPASHDQTANAAFPPIPDNPEPGATAIRTGEPIVTEAEANAEFDAMPSGNTKGKPDLNGLKIKQPKEGQTEFTVSLNGTKEKGELVPTILKVFCAKDSKELTDTLLSYEQSKNRDLLLEILQINQMPESVR
jgi:hypothetical protein